MTVLWCRSPNAWPISVNDRPVACRARYIARCRAKTVGASRRFDLRSSTGTESRADTTARMVSIEGQGGPDIGTQDRLVAFSVQPPPAGCDPSPSESAPVSEQLFAWRSEAEH